MINTLYRLTDQAAQKKLARYLSFMQVGGKSSQREIFELALEIGKHHDPAIRLVALTLNMDHMDSIKDVRKSFETQLEEIRDIKRYYPDHFFPFLGVDPYHKSGKDLKEWAQKNLEYGFLRGDKPYPYFYGIKIYPAHGFFPFDRKLEQLYGFAEMYDIPIMTHCTRSGSMYIGDNIQDRIMKNPSMILPAGNQRAVDAGKKILERIERFYQAGLVRNNSLGNNINACNLFSHPENYIPVLEKFPGLKLCLAHMGGTTEFLPDEKVSENVKKLRKLEQSGKWLDVIRNMMHQYPNLYTDVSYTLSDFDKKDIVDLLIGFLGDPNNPNALGHRVLFGTDYFMTEQEKKELDLYAILLNNDRLNPWADLLTRVNPARYMSNITDYVTG
jgi:predicted TIM-barrel fold metal-dependent hydrolase